MLCDARRDQFIHESNSRVVHVHMTTIRHQSGCMVLRSILMYSHGNTSSQYNIDHQKAGCTCQQDALENT